MHMQGIYEEKTTDETERIARGYYAAGQQREPSFDKRTIENSNAASNIQIMNPDLPITESYPFTAA